MPQARAEKLTAEQKEIIINSYAMGISSTVIAAQLGKTSAAIRTFYSRHNMNLTLPPKIVISKGLIQGRVTLCPLHNSKEQCEIEQGFRNSYC